MGILEEERKKIDEIDAELVSLFERRMSCSFKIGIEKKRLGMDVLNAAREKEIIEKNTSLLKNPELAPYYSKFIECIFSQSKEYQNSVCGDIDSPETQADGKTKKINVYSDNGTYPVYVGNGLLGAAAKLFDLRRKVLVVSDDGVPAEYADSIAEQCLCAVKLVLPRGETTKSFDSLMKIVGLLLENGFERGDAIVAVGGGVIGDLCGFSASVYMRGIDFYNIPTTLLSMVDSSVGGKTAIDFEGIKNPVGTFYQPKGVLIDTDVLKSLSEKEYSCGMAEIIKMAATLNGPLFEKLESNGLEEIKADISDIILESVKTKAEVVRSDTREKGLRRVLNFGHTIGHAIESTTALLHGEAVAVGMLYMSAPPVRERLNNMLEKFGLPTSCYCDPSELCDFITHDKKSTGNGIRCIFCKEIGKWEEKELTLAEIAGIIREGTV